MVNCFSWAVSVFHDGMSLDTGTFSGNQKLPVNRSHTSASFSSCSRFQLIAETRSTSFIPSDTGTPFRRRIRFAELAPPTLLVGADNARNRNTLCFRVELNSEEFVLGRLQLAGIAPILPGHTTPQRAVDAVFVQVPAPATTGVPDRQGQVAL